MAGTGVGAANEYVLVNATISPATAAAVGTTGTPAPAGPPGAPVAFELSGTNEAPGGCVRW